MKQLASDYTSRFDTQINPVMGYNKSVEFEVMKQQINGQGRGMDQRFCYFDRQGGEDWANTTQELDAYRSSGMQLGNIGSWSDNPFEWIRDTILSYLEVQRKFSQESIKFIGLGSGDAMNEINLIKHFISLRQLKTTLFLLDLSDYLLHLSRSNAEKHLGEENFTIPLECDFYKLSNIPQLFYDSTEKPRQLRVGCFFSNTFGNLPNEMDLMKNSLSAFLPGDLFMLVISLKYAPATKTEAILNEDPRFSNYLGKELWEKWATGPVVRYYNGLKNIHVKSILDTYACPIPDSYTIRVNAVVNNEHELAVYQVRRYDLEGLVNAFVNNGWRSLGSKLFGEDQKRACLIFERT